MWRRYRQILATIRESGHCAAGYDFEEHELYPELMELIDGARNIGAATPEGMIAKTRFALDFDDQESKPVEELEYESQMLLSLRRDMQAMAGLPSA